MCELTGAVTLLKWSGKTSLRKQYLDRDPKTEKEGQSRSRYPQPLLHRSGDEHVHRGREFAVAEALETRGRAIRCGAGP